MGTIGEYLTVGWVIRQVTTDTSFGLKYHVSDKAEQKFPLLTFCNSTVLNCILKCSRGYKENCL